jgi:nitrogen regulatory protein PII
MSPDAEPGYELICIILNYGLGSKIMQTARKHGISGGTVFLGKGTVKSRLLDFLALSDVRKEIVLMVSGKSAVNDVMKLLNDKFEFEKPGHGVAFTVSVNDIIGARNCERSAGEEKRGADNKMYEVITVVVDKGRAENVIEVATKAGSKGGTIINARGSGIHETMKLFSMDIEPEKEIVMILSEKETTDTIVSSIRGQLKIDEPGNGIIFTVDVNKAYGLYK